MQPFGKLLEFDEPLSSVPLDVLQDAIGTEGLVLLRGVTKPTTDEVLTFCREWGDLLEWEFGAINELTIHEQPKNYIYTQRAVPFHWDGAFAGKVPHIIFFHCESAPPTNSGGETLFCHAEKLLTKLTPEERDEWRDISITYRTEKIVHYGGEFTAKLIDRHPNSNAEVLRYAEPVKDLNPVSLTIGESELPAAMLERLGLLLYHPDLCYAHRWKQGDIVLADNHSLLHGRRAMTDGQARHLRRVNIMDSTGQRA